MTDATLPTDSQERKAVPLARGVLDYFPAALAEVARLSKAGNDKHNPGEELHHARGKSSDHADCILRHLVDRGKVDPEDGILHDVKVAWRALAMLQEALERRGAPLARGARLPDFEERMAEARRRYGLTPTPPEKGRGVPTEPCGHGDCTICGPNTQEDIRDAIQTHEEKMDRARGLDDPPVKGSLGTGLPDQIDHVTEDGVPVAKVERKPSLEKRRERGGPA